MATFKTKYDLEDTLYIKNDPEQSEYFVVEVTKKAGGATMYGLSFLGEILQVYEFEVTDKIDPLRAMGINKDEE